MAYDSGIRVYGMVLLFCLVFISRIQWILPLPKTSPSAETNNNDITEMAEKVAIGPQSPETTPAAPESKGRIQKKVPIFYCHNGSQDPRCCSPEQCAIVRQSSLYSKCCNNVHPNESFVADQSQPQTMTGYPSYLRNTVNGTTYALLVTATPRSGTSFFQTLLTKLGIPMSNDFYDPTPNGMVSWIHVFKDEEYFGPAKLYDRKFKTMWHLVRDPLKTLTSISSTEPIGETPGKYQEHRQKYVQFISRHAKITAKTTVLDKVIKPKFQFNSMKNQTVEDQQHEQFLLYRGLEFYLGWQKFIVSLQLPRMRLEDLVEHHNMTVLDEMFLSAGWGKPNHQTAIQSMKYDRRRQLRRRLHKNSRKHRPTLEWDELCQVDVTMTQQFLELCHDYGYYMNMRQVC